MSDKKQLESLLKNIQESLKHYSVEELNEAIIHALNQKKDKTPQINYVLSIVSDHFNTTIKTLKKKHLRGNLQEAKQVAYCLLHFNLGLSIRDISNNVFSNWSNSVQTGVTKLKNADIKHKADREFIECYEFLRTKLLENIQSVSLL